MKSNKGLTQKSVNVERADSAQRARVEKGVFILDAVWCRCGRHHLSQTLQLEAVFR